MPEGLQAGDGPQRTPATTPPPPSTSCFSFISEQRARPAGCHSRNPFLRCISHLRHCCWPAKGLFALADNTQQEPKCSMENARPSTRQRPQADRCPTSATATPAQVSGTKPAAGGPGEVPGAKLTRPPPEQMGDNLTFLLSSSYRSLQDSSSLGPSLRAAQHTSAGPSRKLCDPETVISLPHKQLHFWTPDHHRAGTNSIKSTRGTMS